jgi:hypothetical protein
MAPTFRGNGRLVRAQRGEIGSLAKVRAVASDDELCDLWPVEALPAALDLQRRCNRALAINVFALELGNTAVTPSESGYVVPPRRERMSRHLEHARRPQTCPLPTVPSYSEKRFADPLGTRQPLGAPLRYSPVPAGELRQQTAPAVLPRGAVKLREVRVGETPQTEQGPPSTFAAARVGERRVRTAPSASGRSADQGRASSASTDPRTLWNVDFLVLGLKESRLRVGTAPLRGALNQQRNCEPPVILPK